MYKNKNKIKIFVIQLLEDVSNVKLSCPSMVTQIGGRPISNPFPEVDNYKWVTLEESCDLLHEAQSRAVKEYLLN